jgi:hypothetical protein
MAFQTVPESIESAAEAMTLAGKQAGQTIHDMAALADAIRDLCVDVINESDATWGSAVVNKVVAARELCSQIGVLADIANADLGNHELCYHRDARGWLCPPIYHERAQAAKDLESGHA